MDLNCFPNLRSAINGKSVLVLRAHYVENLEPLELVVQKCVVMLHLALECGVAEKSGWPSASVGFQHRIMYAS
jgi:hypothetical protein